MDRESHNEMNAVVRGDKKVLTTKGKVGAGLAVTGIAALVPALFIMQKGAHQSAGLMSATDVGTKYNMKNVKIGGAIGLVALIVGIHMFRSGFEVIRGTNPTATPDY